MLNTFSFKFFGGGDVKVALTKNFAIAMRYVYYLHRNGFCIIPIFEGTDCRHDSIFLSSGDRICKVCRYYNDCRSENKDKFVFRDIKDVLDAYCLEI